MFDLPVLDMKGNTYDGETHVRFSNVQQFSKGDPLSAMGSLPSFGETGMAPVFGTPDLEYLSVPNSSEPGSAPANKIPNLQVRALFGTDKFELEIFRP